MVIFKLQNRKCERERRSRRLCAVRLDRPRRGPVGFRQSAGTHLARSGDRRVGCACHLFGFCCWLRSGPSATDGSARYRRCRRSCASVGDAGFGRRSRPHCSTVAVCFLGGQSLCSLLLRYPDRRTAIYICAPSVYVSAHHSLGYCHFRLQRSKATTCGYHTERSMAFDLRFWIHYYGFFVNIYIYIT